MLYDVCIMINLDNSWLNIVSLDNVASSKNLATLLLDLLESFNVGVHSQLVVQRSHESLTVHRISNVDCLVSFDHSLHKVIIDRLMQEDSSQRCASLSTSTNSGED